MTKASPAVVVATALCAAVISAFPASVAHSTVATASKKNPVVRSEPTIRKMIVKLRNPTAIELEQPLGADRVTAMSSRAGVALRGYRAMSMGASVLRLETPLKLSEARAVAAKIAADPDVEYAEPDMPMRIMAVPPDQSFSLRQWDLFDPNTLFTDNNTQLNANPAKVFMPVGAMNLPGAWSITTGSSSIVVAVIDNGLAPVFVNGNQQWHPEVAAAVLPGYDMVSSDAGGLPANFVANDGDGRDPNAADPGDWITATDRTNFPSACDDPSAPAGQIDSSWHGTHMAGTIVGQWGNSGPGTSTAGIAPGVWVLPVRALGKCGGDSSDVADAILWAAGFPTIKGAPTNPNPARIINMSLGGSNAPCSTTYKNAIQTVSGQALVIAAAGNEGALGVDQPANCPGVLAVTAHTIGGDNADYANIGPEVGISSPGGGASMVLTANDPVPATTNAPGDNAYYTWSSILFGATTPTSTESGGTRTGPAIGGFTGTSGATANVSGVAALVLSVSPSLTPAQLRSVLVNHTRPHPTGSYCATVAIGQCGSGLIDAAAAVAAVAPPPSGGGGGGGGALPLAQLLLLGLFAFVARARRRG